MDPMINLSAVREHSPINCSQLLSWQVIVARLRRNLKIIFMRWKIHLLFLFKTPQPRSQSDVKRFSFRFSSRVFLSSSPSSYHWNDFTLLLLTTFFSASFQAFASRKHFSNRKHFSVWRNWVNARRFSWCWTCLSFDAKTNKRASWKIELEILFCCFCNLFSFLFQPSER